MGEYLQANKILKKLEVEISQQPDSKIKVYSLLSLGNSLNKQGNLEDSELILQKSLSLGENFFTREEMGELWFAFANTLKDLNNNDEALTYYQKIINNTADNDLKSKALVNQLLVFITQEYWQNAHNLVPVIEEEISLLKPSRSNIYTKINFSQNLLTLSAKTDNNYSEKIINILTESLTQVEKIEDQNSQSYIYGMLGKLYLQHQRIGEAKQLTEKALILARTINANDISVQWEAQMGKIYQQEGDRKQAIYFYKNAINNLENLNKELYSNREVQFSFKESIEPIYRSLIDLLLVDKKPSQNNLKESIEIFEQLQVAELKNFFGDGCVVSKSVAEINNQETVIIYPIILPKRLVVITSLSGEKFEYSSVDISELELEGKIIKTRNALHPFISNQKRQQFTQQLYNLLIQPFEQKLISNKGLA